MKDVLVSLFTRDRADLLHGFLTELNGTAASKDNYDIHVIIDTDQVSLYKPVIDKHPDIIWQYEKHRKGNLRHLYIAQFANMVARDYYFLWPMADDVSGFPQNWDEHISSKKNLFPDHCYCLCTNSSSHGRNVQLKVDCYNVPYKRKIDKKPIQPDDWAMVHGLGELFPVFTKKWSFYMEKLYTQTQCPGGCDMVAASILQQLCNLYNEKRNILALPDGLKCINHYTNHHLMSVDKVPFTRKDIKRVVKEMYQYIRSSQ